MTSDVNVADAERWASALGGAALAAYGVKQVKDDKAIAGAMIAAAGTALIYRGATGHCPMYAATGITTVNDTRAALGGARGVNVEEAVTINRAPEELYAFWRNFELLPLFMRNLISVQCIDACHSHWIAKGPAGRTVEWDAEIINEIPGELIGWRTLEHADVVSAGSVRFKAAPGVRGTEVRVKLQYQPPLGRLGALAAWLFGQDPAETIREDLRRFKQLLEAGEIPTTQGQPRGKQSVLNYD